MTQRYFDDSIIGSGGFGQVTACTDTITGERYAKKTLKPGATPDEVTRFVREVRLLSRLSNENIVTVVDSHTSGPPYFFVMPLYQESLDKRLWDISLQQHRVVPIFNRILAGVEYAHANGVIHRDLKPLNVLLNADDDAVVSDFGLGRQIDSESTRNTMSGYGLGSLLYSAPEQLADAKTADCRADVYSLGVILYALHVGPFQHVDLNHRNIPAALRTVIRRATRPQPEDRYATVSELREAWVAASGQLTTASVADQVRAVLVALQGFRGDPTGLVDHLYNLLVSHLDDQVMVFQTVMSLPVSAATNFETRWSDEFAMIIRLFVEYAISPTRNFDFPYLDRIGSQCRELYEASQDPEVRAALMVCVFVLGYDHDRWAVMSLACNLLQASKLPGEGLLIVEGIRAARHRPEWINKARASLAPSRLDHHLRAFFFPDDPPELY